MSDLMKIEVLDTDGAIREAEEAVAGDNRASFFRKAAVGGGALIGSGVLLGGLPELAAARPSKRNDVAILNFALTLEYLEAAFYNEATRKARLTGDVARFTRVVTKHENAHVKFLKSALGRSAKKKPKFNFGNSTSSQTNFLKTAVALEDTGVTAYSGQGGNILQTSVLAAAVSILTVEARHASRFRTLNGQNPAPRTFDKPATQGQVLRAVKKTKFIKGL